ncbi:MAG: bifunctional [glutamate--ammonia ligase]-adenylyl-L-tyrosine phosphorylase/[glutamate--ammonia-ligase] adenylyltransferase [Deltaproteobacteria bacterium]|nr:MAG: bifunctional [glutamate--ammonia ligase]-adenylyl-L-tyrosine phosphorylase/[glutamate--ammonia-ligase] adenylyltransferase [Deltaproteobacteria bacterium]
MDFSFENYLAAPLEISESIDEITLLDDKFISYLEKLKNKGLNELFLNEIRLAGIYSSFFQKNLMRSVSFFGDEDTLNCLHSDFCLEYIENKKITSFEDLKSFLFFSVKKEMMKIAFRDILGKTAPCETFKEISLVAETTVCKAVDFLHGELASIYGEPCGEKNLTPQKLMVVAMGKLGAHELNFSSDIDLIFVFPEKGSTDGEKTISSEEFFIKLARKFIMVFKGPVPGENTYIVDLRLRPFGDSGPIVMSLKAMEHYYETQGREWERYALIKARCITGNDEDISKFNSIAAFFIFKRYLDYGAFDSMRDMKKRILYEIKETGNKNNIKNGFGGIREIEFFGQIFQLIRGGIDKRFRRKKIVEILRLLKEEGYISPEVSKGLESSYTFLRLVENRIQQLNGKQIHTIPENKTDLTKISCALGFNNTEKFLSFINRERNFVHSHFISILGNDSDKTEDDIIISAREFWEYSDNKTKALFNKLKKYDLNASKEILDLLKNFKNEIKRQRIHEGTISKLDRLMPMLISEFLRDSISIDVINRVLGIISAIIRKSCYISLLLENPNSVSRVIELCKKSSWIGMYLGKHPVLLDELLDPRTLYYPPEKDEMSLILDSRISGINQGETERILETICVFKQSMTLRIAAAEISGNYPLMKISDRLTELAEVIIERVLQVTWIELVEKFGYPGDKDGLHALTPDIAVIAYGKLGGIELGYGSDLDLVFVHGDADGLVSGEKNISCSQFYSRLARKILSYLSSHTDAGKMYDIDLRLRPGGSSGVIILSLSSFYKYFSKKAWTFEYQAFVKARIVYGETGLEESFNNKRKILLSLKRDKKTFGREVSEMREKIIKTHGLKKDDFFHLKYDSGGMMDIEFLAQYFVLLKSSENEALTRFTDTVRILSILEREGILKRAEASFLRFAYLAYRAMGHQLDLIGKKPVLEKQKFKLLRKKVRSLWKKYLG